MFPSPLDLTDARFVPLGVEPSTRAYRIEDPAGTLAEDLIPQCSGRRPSPSRSAPSRFESIATGREARARCHRLKAEEENRLTDHEQISRPRSPDMRGRGGRSG